MTGPGNRETPKRPDARGECRRCIYPDYVDELVARLRAAEQREQELVELALTAIDRLRTTYGDWDFADELAKAVGGNTP